MPEIKKAWTVIKCPHCGAEYVPAEIFMPGDLVGRTDSVIKDALGKTIYVDYLEDEQPATSETYTCDICGHTFIVEPVIQYKVKKQTEELDFGSDTVSLL